MKYLEALPEFNKQVFREPVITRWLEPGWVRVWGVDHLRHDERCIVMVWRLNLKR